MLGLQGAVRGKANIRLPRTLPLSAPPASCSGGLRADRPTRLWVVDFSYIASGAGVVCVVFIIEVIARCIVG